MKLLLERWNNFLNEGEQGPELVHTHKDIQDAVVNALNRLSLSHNEGLKIFMIEIAKAESGYNSQGGGPVDGHVANPFQMTTVAIKDTQNTWKLKTLRKRVLDSGAITQPWDKQTVAEIQGNILLGAITAAMYIVHKLNDRTMEDFHKGNEAVDVQVSNNINTRASAWKNRYNTPGDKIGTVNTYLNANK